VMPAATMGAIAAVGIAAILSMVPGAMIRWRASRSAVRVAPSGHPRPASRCVGTH
jgi:hypothetical protein